MINTKCIDVAKSLFNCSGEHGSPIDLCANTNQAKPIFLVNSKYKFHITNDLY